MAGNGNQGQPLSKVAEAVGIALAADVPCMVWGQPGIGKSAMIDALRNDGWHVVVLYGSTLTDAADVVGVTVPTERTVAGIKYPAMTRPLPDWMIEVITAQAAGERVVVVVDEATTAPADAMAALLGLLRDGVVAGSPMKPVRRVMIANPADCGANAWTLPAPIGNRVVHLYATVTANDVIAGFKGAWTAIQVPNVPEGWEASIPAAMGEVADVLQVQPRIVHAMPGNPDEQGQAWPSPRTWEMVARLRAACQASKADPDTFGMLVNGAVGLMAGAEYLKRLGANERPTWKNCLGMDGPSDVTEAIMFAESVAESVQVLYANPSPGGEFDRNQAWSNAWSYFVFLTDAYGPGMIRKSAAMVLSAAQGAGLKYPVPRLWERINQR